MLVTLTSGISEISRITPARTVGLPGPAMSASREFSQSQLSASMAPGGGAVVDGLGAVSISTVTATNAYGTGPPSRAASVRPF